LKVALAKRTSILLLFFSMIVIFSSVNLLAMNAIFLATDNIYAGVKIGTVPVGGLSVAEAQKAISDTFAEQIAKPTITITYEKESWPIAPQDIELTIDAQALAEKAHSIGRTGNIINVLQERYLIVTNGYTVPFTQNYSQDKLSALLTTIAKGINHSAQNASLVYKDKTIQIIPEVWGRQVNLATSLAAISSKLTSNITFTSYLTVEKTAPTITQKDFADVDSLLAAYSTQFDPNNKNRSRNVALAAEKVNNILLHPDEIFSFNTVVGLRLAEYGYKEAPVLIDGKLSIDWGGGVCQVSTTLYNASLLADLDIRERTSHYQPPGYVPLGQDAAVADNLLDFRFKNTSQSNIYITSEVSNNQVTIFIFGKKRSNPAQINIASTSKTLGYETVVKQDNSLPLGREIIESSGQNGFEVTTYRIKSIDGKEVSKELLSSDQFSPENRVIRVGTKSLSRSSAK